jgi:hypothetical protein
VKEMLEPIAVARKNPAVALGPNRSNISPPAGMAIRAAIDVTDSIVPERVR